MENDSKANYRKKYYEDNLNKRNRFNFTDDSIQDFACGS